MAKLKKKETNRYSITGLTKRELSIIGALLGKTTGNELGDLFYAIEDELPNTDWDDIIKVNCYNITIKSEDQ